MKSQGSARVLFITRKFPPSTGGMQIAAYQLYKNLSQITEVKLVKWGGENKWLPLVLPYLFLKALAILVFGKVDVIYLQDGLLAPFGWPLKIFRKPVVITIHGLDITYKNKLYQLCVPRYIRKLHRVICVSNATKQQCMERGIPEEKITVIPHGVSDEFYLHLNRSERHKLRKELPIKLRASLNISDKKLLLSVGRLVERKGFHWFVKDVMPKIKEYNEDCIYLIAGEGAYKAKILKAIENNGLKNHVFLLGQLNNEMLKYLYNIVDICVIPNIPVKNDMEGFGLVALEAASCNLTVVASRIEAIEETISNEENGFLLDPYEARQFFETIRQLLQDDKEREDFGNKAREFTLKTYSWSKMTKKYFEEFRKAAEI